MGRPIDGKGSLPRGPKLLFRAEPPAAHARRASGRRLDLGVRALNTFLTTSPRQRGKPSPDRGR
jgi:flagellum-specific ATP synthase